MITVLRTDALDLLHTIPSDSVDLILTDPPYLISRKSNFGVGGVWNDPHDKRCRNTPPKTDFGEWDKTPIEWTEYFSEFYRVLKKSGTLIFFYDIWKFETIKNIATENKFKQLRICRWDKTNPIPVNSKLNYLSNSSEYFLTCIKGSRPTFHSEYDKGIYLYPICQGKEKTKHPTQKPLTLIKALIEKHSNENDLVLDCFAGSGTTGVACKELNRNCILGDISSDYIDIINQRLSE